MNKKGAEMTIGTIVIIVLALIVLVVLIVGFTQGWGNMWERIRCIGGCGSNVDTVVQSCELACTSGSTHSYCEDKRSLRFKVGDETKKIEVTCKQLADGGKVGDVTLPSVQLSCSNINCGTPEEKDCSTLSKDDCKDGCEWKPDPAADAAPDAGTCAEATA